MKILATLVAAIAVGAPAANAQPTHHCPPGLRKHDYCERHRHGHLQRRDSVVHHQVRVAVLFTRP